VQITRILTSDQREAQRMAQKLKDSLLNGRLQEAILNASNSSWSLQISQGLPLMLMLHQIDSTLHARAIAVKAASEFHAADMTS